MYGLGDKSTCFQCNHAFNVSEDLSLKEATTWVNIPEKIVNKSGIVTTTRMLEQGDAWYLLAAAIIAS